MVISTIYILWEYDRGKVNEFNIMKKIKGLLPLILEHDNIDKAINTVLDCPKKRQLKDGRTILEHREGFIKAVQETLQKGELRLGKYHSLEIQVGPKVRQIQIFPIGGRIILSAVMNVVDDVLWNRYIRTTGSAIKRRGTVDMLKHLRKALESDPVGTQYVYKADIRKFYESIPHQHLYDLIDKYFAEKELRSILKTCVSAVSEEKGISIGLRAS